MCTAHATLFRMRRLGGHCRRWLVVTMLLAALCWPATAQALGTCPPVQNTPFFTIVYGIVTLGEQPAPPGTVIEALSPRGDVVGCFVVSLSGYYGAMYIYGEDTSVSPPIPGMRQGEVVAFRVNGLPAVAEPELIWSNDREPHRVNLSGASSTIVEIALYPGWNLVSIPVQPVDPTPAAVLDSIRDDYDVAYTYSANLGWQRYEPGAPGFVNTLAAITPSQGVWIHATTATTLTVSGTVPLSTTIPLAAGWNLIGYPSLQTRPITEVLSPIVQYCNAVYTYDAVDQADPWKKYVPGDLSSDLTQMEPGHGYWVSVSQNCVLTIEN